MEWCHREELLLVLWENGLSQVIGLCSVWLAVCYYFEFLNFDHLYNYKPKNEMNLSFILRLTTLSKSYLCYFVTPLSDGWIDMLSLSSSYKLLKTFFSFQVRHQLSFNSPIVWISDHFCFFFSSVALAQIRNELAQFELYYWFSCDAWIFFFFLPLWWVCFLPLSIHLTFSVSLICTLSPC